MLIHYPIPGPTANHCRYQIKILIHDSDIVVYQAYQPYCTKTQYTIHIYVYQYFQLFLIFKYHSIPTENTSLRRDQYKLVFEILFLSLKILISSMLIFCLCYSLIAQYFGSLLKGGKNSLLSQVQLYDKKVTKSSYYLILSMLCYWVDVICGISYNLLIIRSTICNCHDIELVGSDNTHTPPHPPALILLQGFDSIHLSSYKYSKTISVRLT